MQSVNEEIPMRRRAFVALAMVSALAIGAALAAAQTSPTWAGTWTVHIEHYPAPRASGRIVDEQWIVTQNGNTVTGKVVVNTREFPIEGTVDGNKIKWKVTTRPASSPEGERYHHFLGTLEGSTIKGTLERPDHSDDGTFVATRARS
jgi:hypothetical protein